MVRIAISMNLIDNHCIISLFISNESGASTRGGLFTEEICKEMAKINTQPVIFALSEVPEVNAYDVYRWTNER